MDKRLEEQLLVAGIDCVEGIMRLDGNETMYMKYLLKFPNDKNYQNLLRCVDEQRWEDAAIYAHALKGLSANLGMKDLQAECQQAENEVPGGKAPLNMTALKRQYNIVLNTILDIIEA